MRVELEPQPPVAGLQTGWTCCIIYREEKVVVESDEGPQEKVITGYCTGGTGPSSEKALLAAVESLARNCKGTAREVVEALKNQGESGLANWLEGQVKPDGTAETTEGGE